MLILENKNDFHFKKLDKTKSKLTKNKQKEGNYKDKRKNTPENGKIIEKILKLNAVL